MKKLNAFGKILCCAGVLAAVGTVVYLVNTATGFMANSAVINPVAVVLPLVFVLCAAVLAVKPDLLKNGTLTGIATFAMSLLMAFATKIFVVERVDVIGDMLNPVNHSDAQVTAVIWSIVGICLFLLAFLGAVIATLSDKLAKK